MNNSPPLVRRYSFLKRASALSRQQFSRHYADHHGPLAVSLAGFRKYTTRYIQNHVEIMQDEEEPRFDGVTITTQVQRPDYSRGFFNEPDYEMIKGDEIYLFDLNATVSVLGQQELVKDGTETPYKALILADMQTFECLALPPCTKLVHNHLDVSTASILGMGRTQFEYALLTEIWFEENDARARVSSQTQDVVVVGHPGLFMAVTEYTMLDVTTS